MKKLIFGAFVLLFGIQSAFAQLSLNGHFYGEDALKFYSFGNNGTARVQGMGGAFTALGGDQSSVIINPAGLGFFNKSEFSITPIFQSSNTTAGYISNTDKLTSSNLRIGQIGAVFSNRGVGTRKKRTAWSFSYNTLANFSSDYTYSGSNNRSSISDYFAEKATARGINSVDLNNEFDTNTRLADNSTALAYQAYLFDPLDGGGYISSELSTPVNQVGNVSEAGNLGQMNVGYGINYDDKTYIGGTVGLQSLNYTQLTDLTETFPNGQVFNGFIFSDELLVKGSGLNLSLGIITKLTENVRLGASIISPTAMKIRETYTSGIKFDQKPNTFESQEQELYTVPNDFNYKITSPLRANIGLSAFLPKKMGVVSIDAEYVGYSMMNIKDKQDLSWSNDQKRGVQSEFKDAINIKAGGELRFGKARVRAGLNYLGDPRKNNQAYNSKSALVGTFGAGIRNNKFFADISYSRTSKQFAFTPYTVSNATDYESVALKQSTGTVGISFGTFF
ncbi:hypothetical protein EGI22_05930 [Lacihabitans sp. LS3-19]|uniref:hypothetical protein n=1 Tax=Lacihabitans sp. LS3-19 TaxID=2487335 RepID=UPI0020CE6EDC|nr:hypothetical protein [Lacihabitans sp. LS3-19]MCP9767442.1 hypothetical protein [Lacihabitans sp. LS3-19]